MTLRNFEVEGETFKSSNQLASLSSCGSRKRGHDGKWDWPFEESEKQFREPLYSVVWKCCRAISFRRRVVYLGLDIDMRADRPHE